MVHLRSEGVPEINWGRDDGVSSLVRRGGSAFQVEEEGLPSGGVVGGCHESAGCAVGAYHAVAGDEDRQGVGREGLSDGAAGCGFSDAAGDVRVGGGPAVGDASDLFEDLSSEGGEAVEAVGEVEAGSAAFEVVQEGTDDGCGVGPFGAGEVSERFVRGGGEEDAEDDGAFVEDGDDARGGGDQAESLRHGKASWEGSVGDVKGGACGDVFGRGGC